MIHLDLDELEIQTLLEMLEGCLSDVRGQIIKAENYEYKEMLKQRREVLLKLKRTLQPLITKQ